MFATREELQRRLTQLESAAPCWKSPCPNASDFTRLFAQNADPIIYLASAKIYHWVPSEIGRILNKFRFTA